MTVHFSSRSLIYLGVLLFLLLSLAACTSDRLSRQVKVAEELYTTQTAESQKLDAHATQVAAQVVASLTAAAPTVTSTSLPPTATPRPSATPKPVVTATAAPVRPTATAIAESPLELEDGWEVYEIPTLQASIALPEGWVGIPIDENMQGYIKELMDTSLANDPELEAYLNEQLGQLKDFGIRFWAFDLETATEESVTNLNISKQTLPLPMPLETLLELNSVELEKLPNVIEVVSAEQVTHPLGEAGELHTQLATADENGDEVLVESLQYVLIRGRDTYWLTFACRSELYDDALPAFQAIANSFRWME